METLYGSLRPEFVEHASPDAIKVELLAAWERQSAARREADALARLLADRAAQIKEGSWPKK
jgi:hypothetical protein